MFWLGHSLTIEYAALDSELALQPGMTKALVRSAVAGAGFQIDEVGEESASFKPHPPQFTVPGAKRRW